MDKILLRTEIPDSMMDGLNSKILKYLKSRFFTTKNLKGNPLVGYTFNDYDRQLGFAYTSSGMFAALWICNDTLYLDCEVKLKISGFAMTIANRVVAVCENENEDLFYIYI